MGSSASTQAGRVTSAGNGHALTLATRVGGAMVQTVLQAHTGQHLTRLFRGINRRHAPNPQRHGHVVQRAEFGQQIGETGTNPSGY
jgi:hypothetical protein